MLEVYVDQLMTEDLVTVRQSQTLADAGAVMASAGINSVVVSNRDNHPVGILTSTDFVRMAADEDTPTQSSVGEYMTQDIVTTTPGTVVHEAANLMEEHSISHLPVVQDDDELAGIVTTTDVAAYVSNANELLQD
jgi:CBS domain-containing protein